MYKFYHKLLPRIVHNVINSDAHAYNKRQGECFHATQNKLQRIPHVGIEISNESVYVIIGN